MRRVTVTIPPAEEPLTLAETKVYLRIGHDADDPVILTLIAAARRYAEQWLGRAFITQTIEVAQTDWPGLATAGYLNRLIRQQGPGVALDWLPGAASDPIELPRPPLQSVVSVEYFDQAGAWVAMPPASYQVSKSDPARLAPAMNTIWPIVSPQAIESIRITLQVGYGDPAAVPPSIKIALLLWVAYLYENRGEESAEPPAAVQSLLSAEDFGRYG